jgi:hypothetical protein
LQPANAEEKPPGRCGAAPVWLGIANGGTTAADKRRRAYDCGENKGTLPKRRRGEEFSKLRDDEVASLELIVRDAFEGFEGAGVES